MSNGISPTGNSTSHDLKSSAITTAVKCAPSPILHQNQDSTITLLDIPRSIEAVQGSPSEPCNKRLFSTPALEHPYPSVEPKSKKALAALPEVSLQELLLEKHVHLALEEVKNGYSGPWCLPRVVTPEGEDESPEVGIEAKVEEDVAADEDSQSRKRRKIDKTPSRTFSTGLIYNDTGPKNTTQPYHIPPKSKFLLHDIGSSPSPLPEDQTFDLIVLDPPWPNRSAHRSNHYRTVPDIRGLLNCIHVPDHLHNKSLLGIWITNKSAYRDMVLGSEGLFDQWGLEHVEEWIWLKVTVEGEPIVPIESRWRKPYEVLLVASQLGQGEMKKDKGRIRRRVIVGVPDLHSRKPNLQALFEPLLGEGYKGLEIFARNLTAGWWAWGNEVLKFQHVSCWSDEEYPCEATSITEP